MKFSELLGNKFVRITLLIFFFLFIYKILFAIGIFFAIDANILSMYLCWIGMVMLFAALLQTENTNFKVPSSGQVESTAAALFKKVTETFKSATGETTTGSEVVKPNPGPSTSDAPAPGETGIKAVVKPEAKT